NAAFAFLDSYDTTDIHYEDTIKGGGFINDPELAKILVEESPQRLVDLENYGAIFDRQKSGKLDQRPFGGQKFRRTCFQGDRTGHEIITALKEEIIRRKIINMDEIMITALIMDEERRSVQGAVGLSLKDSKMMCFQAKSTILATGGAGHIYPVTSNTVQKGGDGFALAWKAGADLIDMEQVQFHPTGMVYPESRKGVLVTEAVRGEGGILLDKDFNRFMGKYDPRMELATRDVVARAIYNEIREGRGTENGGIYLDVTHLDPEIIGEKLETMVLQFSDVGVDICKEPMEVAPTAHHFMGGVKIDENGHSSVGNLFAAGEVTGGVHGANRLGGNALADTQVFGERAGKAAAENALKSNDGLNQDFVKQEEKRIKSKIKDGDISPQKIKKDLQKTMWDNVAIIRNENGLRMALKTISHLDSELSKMNVSEGSSFNRALQNALEVENMIETAKMVITAAVLRQESRGSHYREDFPDIMDGWKKSIVLNRNGKIGLISRV
ncbi:MAG: fumarate reductase (CoM/CoB) subunit TfrA, partial [Methanobacteriaceae archaeon]|nr:fumarate reductase (CoM/CoB) subunit TfrA [Methanobacteriaceae archaeon]